MPDYNSYYSYIYRDFYFYRDDILNLVDEVARERDELRPTGNLITSFATDLKNKILGIERPLKKIKKQKPYQKKCGTWFNADGTVMNSEDVGKV